MMEDNEKEVGVDDDDEVGNGCEYEEKEVNVDVDVGDFDVDYLDWFELEQHSDEEDSVHCWHLYLHCYFEYCLWVEIDSYYSE